MSYAELVCQSNFSFLNGASHPEELVQKAAEYGYSAIAITDECSVAGVVRAYSFIKENGLGIKLIVGSSFVFQGSFRFVLLCPNRKAYAELCRIVTNARRRCEKGQYELSEWDLKSLKHCLLLWLPEISDKDNQNWGKWIQSYLKIPVWLALGRQLLSNEAQQIIYFKKLSEQFNLPITACGEVLMHSVQRLPLQHVIMAIRLGCKVSELGKQALKNSERSIRTLSKLLELFPTDWLLESLHIASSCEFSLDELSYEYPAELIPKGKTATDYLRELVEKGKKLRFPDGVEQNISEIIEKELQLIEEMAYEHFFITIYDVVQFAKREQILYQGRGSAANSVVCYCLEITAVDPNQIQVLFERFISKERHEPPDIDVDFEHQRREEVFQYIYSKYGRNHTAIAATVVTYRMKSAIREVGKALGINETQLDFFIKNINRRDTQSDWRAQISELGLDIKSKKGIQFIQLVDQIRGFPRHLSQHVGGFVISSGPLYELVPVENAAMEGRTVIQWDKDDLESLKLLKVDVLALGMLTAIRKSFDLIREHYGYSPSIAQISGWGDDPQVYRAIRAADTVGVFQIESRAQMSMLPRLRPVNYYDLVIQIAIVRPGPIQGGMVHPFLKRRDKMEAVEYPSDEVKGVLERTLGVPIFQEQVIKLAMVAAGFSGGEAEQLRRAMGKWRKTGELDKFRNKLIDGMLERGYKEEFAERIFQQICGFGEYGFPESHSASFAVLAYVSAWLKHYFPEVFYCALLNSLPMGFYSASQLLQDAKRHQVITEPVDINLSNWDHYLERCGKNLVLRLGFRIVKGLSQASVERIMTVRKDTCFGSVSEVKQLGLRSNELQALASSGCFQSIAGNRYLARWQMLNNEDELPLLLQEESPGYEVTPSNYDDLIEDYASLGLSLDKHPITLLQQSGKLGHYTPASELATLRHKSVVTVVGVVVGRQSPGTASGVTFMTLEDDTGNSNIVVWVATARAQKRNFLTAKVLKVKGILEREKQVVHVIAGKLIDLTDSFESLNTSSRDFH